MYNLTDMWRLDLGCPDEFIIYKYEGCLFFKNRALNM